MNASEFNARYPIGTPVVAYPGCRPQDDANDERLVTRTRSKAEVLGGHTDVVWVDGHGACIALTHIDVRADDAALVGIINPVLAAAIAKQGIPLTADMVAPEPAPQRQYPISPRPDDDSRFTLGLAFDVAKVLHEHGYPKLTNGRDFLELQQALFGFLYVGPDEGAAS